ncbi:MAG: hypothetical protein IJ220_08605 [Clostridia bacterium]|nr:hypothetical protein [Clostridia bacterium]
MSSTISYDVHFTLKRIRTQGQYCENINDFEVVFMLKDIKNANRTEFLAFYFTSFDMMSQHLRSLAKHMGLFSIDALMKGEYSATIESEEHFNAPSTFKAFIINNYYVWPFKRCPAHFLIDFPE